MQSRAATIPNVEMTLTIAARYVARVTGQELAEVSLRQACSRGALRATKLGKYWMVTEADLMDYLNNRPAHFQPDARLNVTDNNSRGTIQYRQKKSLYSEHNREALKRPLYSDG